MEFRRGSREGKGMSRIVRRFAAAAMLCAFASLAAIPATIAQEEAPSNVAPTGPRLDFPAGVVTDGSLIYVANSRNNTIDKIDLTSHGIALLAGQLFKTGSNDGSGASALFASPSGMTLAGGNIYLVDTNNSIIRRVTPGGQVTTVAGSPNLPGTDDGKGSVAHFNLPTQIASDPNGSRLFVTDSGSSTIRMISLPDMIVKTIAGQADSEGKTDGPASKSQFNRPRGISTDGKFLYISDTGNNCIRKIDLSSMNTTTLAGSGEEGSKDGAGTEAQFNNPGAMATDGTSVYLLDADNHAIRKIDANSGEVKTITQVNGHIGSGCTLSKDGHLLYFSDTTENAVQQADLSNGNVSPVYPTQ